LQAVETEVSVQKMQKVLTLLKSHQTRLVLYTYDSILIDLELSEIKIIPEIRHILESGNFPVKIKYGINYNQLHEIKK
jgi:hypothetical protein